MFLPANLANHPDGQYTRKVTARNVESAWPLPGWVTGGRCLTGGERQLGRLRQFDGSRANGRKRRIVPVAARHGEGLLTEPTADARLSRWEPLLAPIAVISYHESKTIESG